VYALKQRRNGVVVYFPQRSYDIPRTRGQKRAGDARHPIHMLKIAAHGSACGENYQLGSG